jgi:hypothetical protein
MEWHVWRIFSVSDLWNGIDGEYSLYETNGMAYTENILCMRPMEWHVWRIFSVCDQWNGIDGEYFLYETTGMV